MMNKNITEAREQILLKKRYALVCIILSTPILFSFFYSNERDLLSSVGTMLFIFAFSISIYSLANIFRTRVIRHAIPALFVTIVYILETVKAISFYFQGEGFNERFYSHLTMNTISEAWLAYPQIAFSVAALLILLVFALYRTTKREEFPRFPASLSVALLLVALVMPSATKDLLGFYVERQMQFSSLSGYSSEELAKLNLNPKALSNHEIKASPGKNLVLIYLESLEKIYLEEQIFPDLTPNLNNLSTQGIHYSNIKQTPGTSWTIGGIVASQCGTPMLTQKTLSSANELMNSDFLSKTVCLGDVLHGAGYNQTYLGGASIKFAGKKSYFDNHGYSRVLGKDELSTNPLYDENYLSGWGVYDDTLFDIAFDEFQELADKQEPFNLTLLTIDTHHPDGHPSKSCMPYPQKDNSILHAVYCTDQLVGRFIDKISKHPEYKNTVIALLSDHLAMRNAAQKYYPEAYERKVFLTILNAGGTTSNNQEGTHMDIAPTILEALQVRHNADFLAGSSLLTTSPKQQINFSDSDVNQAISYINDHTFSLDNNITCDQGELINTTGNSLYIGNKQAQLFYRGLSINKDQFQATFNDRDVVLLAHVSKNNVVEYSKIIPRSTLLHYLTIEENERFIILMKTKDTPRFMENTQQNESGRIAVFFGQLNKNFIDLGRFADIGDIKISMDNCASLTRSLDSMPRLQLKLDSQECLDENHLAAHYNAGTETVDIPEIWHDNTRFTAKLKRTDNDLFVVSEYEPLSEKSDSAIDECSAVYLSDTVILPAVEFNKVKHRVIMKKALHGDALQMEVAPEFSSLFKFTTKNSGSSE